MRIVVHRRLARSQTARLVLMLAVAFVALSLSNFGTGSTKQLTVSELAPGNSATPKSVHTALLQDPKRGAQELAPSGSSGSTSLFMLTGSSASIAFGDYVSNDSALDTSYHFFVEVPSGQSRLVIDIFDADIGLGGSTEDTAGRDRDRGGFDTTVSYSVFNPTGSQRTTLFSSGDDNGPTGSDNAWLSLLDSTGDTFRDNFASASYSNNNGLLSWATNWTESNDDNDAGAGVILITGGELRIRDNASGGVSTIQREANLSTFSTATLTFNFRTENVEAGDEMRVEVSNNGGGSWTTLESFVGSFGASSRSYSIDSSIASNTRIRFIQVSGYSGTDSFFVDNLQIKENTIDAGHWEVRINLSSAITNGDDINALGLRAHDGTAGAGGTELNVYVDSIIGVGANPPASGTNSRSYTMYPYVTAGCTFGENDFDFDSNSGNVGSMSFTSRSGFFTQTLTSATLSSDNSWNRDTITGWNSDGSATEYGVWSSNLTVNSYLVSGTPNGNYGNVYLSNYQSAANPPAANPTANAFRIYLPTDASTAPVKPYLRHTFVNPLGPNPPPIGVPIPFSVIVAFVNPTPYAITFDATHLVTVNVPGGGSVFGGNAQVTLGSLVSQPAVGGTGNLTWNPGVVAAGSTALLSYTVVTTFSSNGQRIPLSATPASGNGTRAFFIDETGNTAQTRASYTFGPMCELAATAGLATAAPATISGLITTSAGEPLGGVSVKLGGDKIDRTITDSSGVYRFTDVDTDGFYSVTPTLTNFNFAPRERSFSLLGDRTDAVFTAVPTTQLGNPLDEEGFFVRQQYLDFLNREPDHSGFLYWSDEIASCGGDAACIRARRIAVSASFFASEEFQQTGSFVYRLYRAGLARPVTFAEFLASGPKITVGPGGDTSRDKFARDFCERADFIARFSAATTPESFVDALIASIKNDSGADLINQRDALLTAYNAVSSDVGLSRSRVLRLAIEQPAFTQAEFNRAFVLMQYFGYLRRDPDQGGFDFWLDVLNNRERNNYLAMVCAFVTSTEYQQRFASFISRGNAECGQ